MAFGFGNTSSGTQTHYRNPGSPKSEGTPATFAFLGIGVLVFLIEFFLNTDLVPILSLAVYRGELAGGIWQFLTYGFIHADLLHIVVNSLGLFFFGAAMERVWGSLDFTLFYLVTILGSGLIAFGFYALTGSSVYLLGASGGVYGLIIAFSSYYPRRNIYLFGVIPVQARFFILLFLGITVYSILSNNFSDVSHIAHMGGIVVAWIYLLLRFRVNAWARMFGNDRNTPPHAH